MARLCFLAPLVFIAVIGMVQPEAGESTTDTDATTTQATGAAPETEQPARSPGKPFQEDILRTLLNAREAPTMIAPQNPDAVNVTPTANEGSARGQNALLMVEGTMIVERPGRLALADGKAEISLRLSDGRRTVTMQILPNSLLEAMEAEAHSGTPEFVVSGEITTYHGRNYLFLHKVIRRVGHGNLAP